MTRKLLVDRISENGSLEIFDRVGIISICVLDKLGNINEFSNLEHDLMTCITNGIDDLGNGHGKPSN